MRNILTEAKIPRNIFNKCREFAINMQDYTDQMYIEENNRRPTNIEEMTNSKIVECFASRIFNGTDPDFSIHTYRSHDPDIFIGNKRIHIKMCGNPYIPESYSFNADDPIIKNKEFADNDFLAGFKIFNNSVYLRLFTQIKNINFRDTITPKYKGMFFCAYLEDFENPLQDLRLL